MLFLDASASPVLVLLLTLVSTLKYIPRILSEMFGIRLHSLCSLGLTCGKI